MEKQILKQLENLPLKPGVYFFKDKAGKILYVGKAQNLKKRVCLYFQNSKVLPVTLDRVQLGIDLENPLYHDSYKLARELMKIYWDIL